MRLLPPACLLVSNSLKLRLPCPHIPPQATLWAAGQFHQMGCRQKWQLSKQCPRVEISFLDLGNVISLRCGSSRSNQNKLSHPQEAGMAGDGIGGGCSAHAPTPTLLPAWPLFWGSSAPQQPPPPWTPGTSAELSLRDTWGAGREHRELGPEGAGLLDPVVMPRVPTSD